MWPFLIGGAVLYLVGRAQRLTPAHPVNALSTPAPSAVQALGVQNLIASPAQDTAQIAAPLVAGEGDGEISSSVMTLVPDSPATSSNNPELKMISSRPAMPGVIGWTVGKLPAKASARTIVSKTPITTRPVSVAHLPARTASPAFGSGRPIGSGVRRSLL